MKHHSDETSQTQLSNFLKTDVFSHIEVVDGRIWLRPEGTKYFCGHLSEQEQKLVWGVPKPELFEANVGGTAWKSKPSWFIVGKKNRTIHPDLERATAGKLNLPQVFAWRNCPSQEMGRANVPKDGSKTASLTVQN